MDWKRATAYRQASDGGYSVTAVRCGDVWRFVAWGPAAAPEWSYRDYAKGLVPHWAGAREKVSYALGEHVPQMHEHLGCRDTAEDARAMCEAHAARSTNHNAMGVQQCLTTRR